MRTGEARVAKRIDQFLVSEKMMESHFQVRQWIGSGGESDHSLVWLELEGGSVSRHPLSNSMPLGSLMKTSKTW
jgi:hypothetical protein